MTSKRNPQNFFGGTFWPSWFLIRIRDPAPDQLKQLHPNPHLHNLFPSYLDIRGFPMQLHSRRFAHRSNSRLFSEQVATHKTFSYCQFLIISWFALIVTNNFLILLLSWGLHLSLTRFWSYIFGLLTNNIECDTCTLHCTVSASKYDLRLFFWHRVSNIVLDFGSVDSNF